MPKSLDQFRRDAKALRRAHEAGDADALTFLKSGLGPLPDRSLKHADYLHAIARAEGFASWPALKAAAEVHGMDRAARIAALTRAAALGQGEIARALLEADPDLPRATPGLAAALYEPEALQGFLAKGDGLAAEGTAPPFIHLCRSRMWSHLPDRAGAMITCAEAFLAAGIDVNQGTPRGEGHQLSPLYYALGHAGNLALARWLLEHGADPDDNESLYHACELGHVEGVRLLAEFGVDPRGTNALPRALDFDDPALVRAVLDAGADPNEVSAAPMGGEAPMVIPALPQAARRMQSMEIVEMLLEAGADPMSAWKGRPAYVHAAVYGHESLRKRLEAMGAAVDLAPAEVTLAAAARGEVRGTLSPEDLPEAFAGILGDLIPLPGKMDHIKALVALGLTWDRPDPHEALTPVQAAGWAGWPEVVGYFLSLGPDLTHVNAYGGTLLSTIIHGSENNPLRAGRDHAACARLALEAGHTLPARALELASDPDVAAVLADWAEAHPETVVTHGIA